MHMMLTNLFSFWVTIYNHNLVGLLLKKNKEFLDFRMYMQYICDQILVKYSKLHIR